jgi:hypothetical protein
MAVGLGSAVHGEVLGRRHHFQIARVVALQPFYEGDAHLRCKVRVLAVGLLSAAPARIAKDVDVRRPERQSLVATMLPVPERLVMLRARLVTDDGADLVHQRHVEGCGHPDRLRKDRRGARSGDAVQALVPPVVFGYTEPWDRRRAVHQLRDLLVERHARHEVGGTRIGRRIDVEVDRRIWHLEDAFTGDEGGSRNHDRECDRESDRRVGHSETGQRHGSRILVSNR